MVYLVCILYITYIKQGIAMRKMIDFQGLEEKVQKYANNNHNGNFNEAVRELLKKALPDE